MLDFHFLGQNLHFAVGLWAALVMFSVSWLNFDAWLNRRKTHSLLIFIGFLSLSLSFLAYGADIESLTQISHISRLEIVYQLLSLFGLICIIIAQIINPLQKVPHYSQPEAPANPQKTTPAILGVSAKAAPLGILLPIASLITTMLYWRRSTTGLERHLKPVAVAFLSLTIFEVLSLSHLLQTSTNVVVYNLVAPFGVVWALEQVALFVTATLFGKWVWNYLTKRFTSQLFMIFIGSIVAVFVVITICFTALLLRNIQSSTLANLKITANVLNYALESKRSDTLANAESVANNPLYVTAIQQKDHKKLATVASSYLASQKQSSLIITDEDGRVLLRGEDSDRWGDSLSSDPLIRRGLIGEKQSSMDSVAGVIAPTIFIKSTAPVRDASGTVIGTITSGVAIDNAFVDGIKNATGLEASVYSDKVRSATTTLAADGKSRWVGVKEETPEVNRVVLKQGETFGGSIDILNRSYLAVYRPLKDVDNGVVGMILIGQPQTQILQTANQSIQKTFLVAVVLLLFSVVPAYFVARYIEKQI